MINYISIGKKIRQERMMRNFTLEQLAEILDLSPSYMGLIERGQRGISIETLCKLSIAFNVSTDYLLFSNDIEEVAKNNVIKDILHQKILSYIDKYSEEDLKFLLEFLQLKSKYDT
ncbi:DNA-binding transcriptional regulator, XRE-family HTH domain [Natronincola peptidivorans]|uniref:DNA-binding transcriptional regulator, XRE-family HTH domain n=1 Tax=Natronincola peptidivorans TaxID=426128 RepID=A0A1I0DAI5_9FIRM|nr:helix-turn-helix transcriptional regulator [Natronincola peptidivorans]SET28996.1 DNA-binding transcriptional regulator, XRE-family HTH domain [Natronincola peptidivorans]